MTQREKLIELIKNAKKNSKEANCDFERDMLFADYLLENGVIAPPCKVGDDLWCIRGKHIEFFEVARIVMWAGTMYFESLRNLQNANEEEFGKFVFLTKEEAEKALAEKRADNG